MDRHVELANITYEMLRLMRDAFVQRRPVIIRQTVIFPTLSDEMASSEVQGLITRMWVGGVELDTLGNTTVTCSVDLATLAPKVQ
jgi:hypothetical protein